MNSKLIQHLARALASSPIGLPVRPLPQPDLGQMCHDPFALLRVALVVKYGGNLSEAANKFIEESEVVLNRCGVDFKDSEPTLTEKLDALKASVGDETFQKLLANPEVESMASRAYRKARGAKSDKALIEISTLFNDAIPVDQLASILDELSQSADPITELAEA